MACMICLEEGADVFPPCHNLYHRPLFHKRCLDLANYCQDEPKCPHCNLLICKNTNQNNNNTTKMEGVKHKIESIIQRWLQDKGYWIKGPEYIQLKDFLMCPIEANTSIKFISKIIKEQLSKISCSVIFFSNLPAPDQDAIVYRHRDVSDGIETDVLIRRTAIFNDCKIGSFRMDGYTISMSRTRYSPRYYRQPCIFEGKEEIFIS